MDGSADAGANALVTEPSVSFRGHDPPLRRHFLHPGPGKPPLTPTRPLRDPIGALRDGYLLPVPPGRLRRGACDASPSDATFPPPPPIQPPVRLAFLSLLDGERTMYASDTANRALPGGHAEHADLGREATRMRAWPGGRKKDPRPLTHAVEDGS